MAEEPVPGQPGNGVESTRLLEQVSGAGHHGQVVLAAQLRLGPAVEIQHHLVAPADDQQRRRGHRGQPGTGQIWAAAAGHHGRDASARLGRRQQRRRGAGAGAEVADGGPRRARLGAQPSGHLDQAAGEQADVEHVGPVPFLLGGEQVEQQRAQAGILQNAGDMLVARAVPAAAAAVDEHHNPWGACRHGQVAGQPDGAGLGLDFLTAA